MGKPLRVVAGLAFAVLLPWMMRARAPALAVALPALVNLALAWMFGRTLRRGREPLVGAFARAERGALTPELARYTRRLTAIWVAFFIAMAAVSLALAALGFERAWTWFTLAGNYALAAALFVGEYLWRRWRLPQYEHAPPLQMIAHVGTVLRNKGP